MRATESVMRARPSSQASGKTRLTIKSQVVKMKDRPLDNTFSHVPPQIGRIAMLGEWEYANRGRKKIGDNRGSQTRKAHLTSVGGIEPELSN